ncbi:MAG: hypothetical protein K0U98_00035 [Deltaproteobacteria bacterium]|nr:hypothetical protein [Deltaproteobacteria bacterium]
MKPFLRLSSLLLATACLCACTSTHFISTWQDPDAVFGQLNGEKVVAFLISDNESSRRSVEDSLARELTARGAQGLAGYTLMPTKDAKDEAVAKKKLEEAGVDAVITLRLVSKEQAISSTPATWHLEPTYRIWDGYWVRGWKEVFEPGYFREDTIVQVETVIYSMESKGMIWAGISETFNPSGADALIKELADAIDKSIKKSGLLH